MRNKDLNYSIVKQLHVRIKENKKLWWFKYSLKVKKKKRKGKEKKQERHFSSSRDLMKLRTKAPVKIFISWSE